MRIVYCVLALSLAASASGLAGTRPATATTIADPGFELFSAGTDIFTSTTIITANLLTRWGVDSAIIANAENGITPNDGLRMARANAGVSTDIYTVVDVSSLSAGIAAQQVVADLSAFFNATAANQFNVSLGALAGSFNFSFSDVFGSASSVDLISDTNLATWEENALNGWLVPAGADYVLVGVHMLLDVSEPSYADSVSLAFRTVPEPSPLSLALAGLLLLGTGQFRCTNRRR